MEGIVIILLFVSAMFLLFLWRLWTFLARHPLIRLLDGTSLIVYVQDADAHGQPASDPRAIRIYLEGKQGRRNNRH